MPKPLIELKGISKSFGSNVVLDGADLSIYPGEALAVIGPSGTGKSTILRIIAGLSAPDAGEIYIGGKQRRGLIEDEAEPLRIGMVFQQAALFDSLTVDENVGFFLYQHSKLPRRRIRELVNQKLEMVGLGGISDLYPAQLSGGMRKRVSFARAIMEDPDDPGDDPRILLYDEPTAGLDPIASTIIEDLISQLHQVSNTCATYVVVTHQNSTIRRTATRIVLLYQGQVRWQGTADDIDTTDNPFIQQFFSGRIEGPIEAISH